MGTAELLPSYILDNPRILIERCYLALPVFGAQTIFPGPELMDDLFLFDLSRYVAWYKAWVWDGPLMWDGFTVNSVEIAATFFIWMKLKVCFPLPRDELLKDVHRIQSHPDYDGDLFHQHVQAIDAWIIDQIRWLVPYDRITIATSISFLPFPRPNGGMDSDWVLPESDMLMNISELQPSLVDTRCPCTELIFSLEHVRLPGCI